MPADELVDQLLGPILADLAPKPGDRVVLLVNNLGGTPGMELAVVARRAVSELRRRGLVVERAAMGTFLSALDPALGNDFLAAYLDEIKQHYRPRYDGKVLLPFPRVFIVAVR